MFARVLLRRASTLAAATAVPEIAACFSIRGVPFWRRLKRVCSSPVQASLRISCSVRRVRKRSRHS